MQWILRVDPEESGKPKKNEHNSVYETIRIVEIIHYKNRANQKRTKHSVFSVSSKLTILYTILFNQVKIKTSRHGSKIETIITKCVCVCER